ncbi:DNA replication and repair protein RecR [Alkalibacterium subtropicum]|uniref:Recombination protein RecR n=2 Tax=Alkalibacterium subtropicum TaxID=753702 RepID=A0A1I1IHN2_9LACT|nr:DNA replication and repair protein RecR [Alkalibacterium subtropicum]
MRKETVMHYPEPIAQLMESYMKLPGIGEKTAARLAFYTVNMQEEDVTRFAKSLISVKRDLQYCSVCGNMTQNDPCDICEDKNRDQSVILVVEHPKDVIAMEKMQDFKGLYHVLHGVLSPVEGTGPEDINIPVLIKRLQKDEVKEVIIATNATAEGEATAMYLSRLIKPAGIKVTRLAHGLSVGSDIEYADEVTLLKAVEGRREM